MAKTPGTIIELPKDRTGQPGWRLIVPLPRDPHTGKRRQQWVTLRGVSRRDAERELARLVTQGAQGVETKGERVTVAVYCERWLKVSAAERVKPSTLQRYRELLAHLEPYIGRHKLTALTSLQVQEAYARIRAEGLSPKTVLNVHRVLHAALTQAMRWGLVARNVTELVDAPRAPQYEAALLSPEDVARALDVADATPFGNLARLAVLTGMRQGELLALRWVDVDLVRSVVHVRRTARRMKGQGVVFTAPKTARSTRPVPLSSAAGSIFEAHRIMQRAARVQGIDGLVFCREDGSALDGSYVNRVWREVSRKAGVNARWHDLRHAFATFALQGGVSVKVVSEIMGHSRTSITENLYMAVLPGLKEDGVSVVASAIAAAFESNRLEAGLEAAR